MKKTDENLIIGLDIGTSKILAIVAEVKDDWRRRDYWKSVIIPHVVLRKES